MEHYINGESANPAWLREMRTIEGELECTPDIHDFVSCLRPRVDEQEADSDEQQ